MQNKYHPNDIQYLPKSKITKQFYKDVNELSKKWSVKNQAAKEKEQVAFDQMKEER